MPSPTPCSPQHSADRDRHPLFGKDPVAISFFLIAQAVATSGSIPVGSLRLGHWRSCQTQRAVQRNVSESRLGFPTLARGSV